MDSDLKLTKEAWSTNRPRYVEYLESRGVLLAALVYARERIAEEVSEMGKAGIPFATAMRDATDKWVHLPTEETAPELPSDLAIFGQPDLTMRSRRPRIR